MLNNSQAGCISSVTLRRSNDFIILTEHDEKFSVQRMVSSNEAKIDESSLQVNIMGRDIDLTQKSLSINYEGQNCSYQEIELE